MSTSSQGGSGKYDITRIRLDANCHPNAPGIPADIQGDDTRLPSFMQIDPTREIRFSSFRPNPLYPKTSKQFIETSIDTKLIRIAEAWYKEDELGTKHVWKTRAFDENDKCIGSVVWDNSRSD